MKVRIQYILTAVAFVVLYTAVTKRQPWLIVAAFVVFLLLAFQLSRNFNADFSVIVGQTEKHEVHFWWNQWTGRVRITVDGESQLRTFHWFSIRRIKKFEVSVGTEERHDVTFLKTRSPFFGAYRKQRIQVLVDGVGMAAF